MTALRGRALAEATLAHIEAHPEEWDQMSWRCGTTACFAGHAAILGGAAWEDPCDDWMVQADGEMPYESVGDRAERLLGIDYGTGVRLFWGTNTLADLRRIVAEIWPTDGAR